MATEHHWKVKHFASFLILELVQVTQRQNHVTAFTLQFLVVSKGGRVKKVGAHFLIFFPTLENLY